MTVRTADTQTLVILMKKLNTTLANMVTFKENEEAEEELVEIEDTTATSSDAPSHSASRLVQSAEKLLTSAHQQPQRRAG